MAFFRGLNDRGQSKRCFAINVGVSLYQYLHNVYPTVVNGHMQRGPTLCCRNVCVIILGEHKLNLSYISSINSGSKASGIRLAESRHFRLAGGNGFRIAIRRSWED